MNIVVVLVIIISMTFVSAFNRSFKRIVRSPVRMSSNTSKFILEYSYVPDILEKRAPFRAEHLALAESLSKEGIIIAAGPFNPPTGAQFLFNTEASVLNFINKDPYVKAKLVTDFKIREWNVLIGGLHSKL